MSKEAKNRVTNEFKDLNRKVTKLNEFITSESFHNLPTLQKALLEEQKEIMFKYINVLKMRLDNWW
jgi:hypothetical protein